MKTRNHKLLDHPILGYFLLILFSLIIANVLFCSVIDTVILAKIVPGYANEATVMGKKAVQASGIGIGLGAITAAIIFKLWFKPSFDGMLKTKRLLTGILLLLPMAIVHWAGSIVSWTEFGTASVFLALLRCTAPGFGEEVTFRGLGVANYMRRNPTEKGILTIFWLSSVVFGLAHLGNLGGGAPLYLSILQSLYAIGIGMGLGAAYLRTGNLWPSMIIHATLDFMEFVRNDVGEAGGLLSNLGVGDWITVSAGVLGAIWGLYLIRSSKRTEIVEIWKKKWSIDS